MFGWDDRPHRRINSFLGCNSVHPFSLTTALLILHGAITSTFTDNCIPIWWYSWYSLPLSGCYSTSTMALSLKIPVLYPPFSSKCQNQQFTKNIEWWTYPLVHKHSYWKWPCIVDLPDLPIENGDFPVRKLLVYQRVYPLRFLFFVD